MQETGVEKLPYKADKSPANDHRQATGTATAGNPSSIRPLWRRAGCHACRVRQAVVNGPGHFSTSVDIITRPVCRRLDAAAVSEGGDRRSIRR